MHDCKRIELIIEKMAYKRAGRILEASGLKGYSILPALAGFGQGTHWSRDTDISASRDMVVMIAIGRSEAVEKAMVEVENLLGAHVGVVSVTDVKVLRPDRF